VHKAMKKLLREKCADFWNVFDPALREKALRQIGMLGSHPLSAGRFSLYTWHDLPRSTKTEFRDVLIRNARKIEISVENINFDEVSRMLSVRLIEGIKPLEGESSGLLSDSKKKTLRGERMGEKDKSKKINNLLDEARTDQSVETEDEKIMSNGRQYKFIIGGISLILVGFLLTSIPFAIIPNNTTIHSGGEAMSGGGSDTYQVTIFINQSEKLAVHFDVYNPRTMGFNMLVTMEVIVTNETQVEVWSFTKTVDLDQRYRLDQTISLPSAGNYTLYFYSGWGAHSSCSYSVISYGNSNYLIGMPLIIIGIISIIVGFFLKMQRMR